MGECLASLFTLHSLQLQRIVHHAHRGNSLQILLALVPKAIPNTRIFLISLELLTELAHASVLQVLEQRAWLLTHLEPSPALAGRPIVCHV
jgi:hypothetical protein